MGLGWLLAFTTLLTALPARSEPALTVGPAIAVDKSEDWVPHGADRSSLASYGTGSLAVYTSDEPVSAETYIMGRRLNADGTPEDLPFEIYQGGSVDNLQLVFDGTGYLLLWSEVVGPSDYALRFLRLKADGSAVSDPETLEQSSHWMSPAMAVGETGTFVARGTNEGLRTWVIKRDAVVAGDAISSSHYVSPVAGFSDGAWLVAYWELQADDSSHFVQFGGDGKVIPGTDASLAGAPKYSDGFKIAAMADGFAVSRIIDQNFDLVHVDFDGNAEVAPTNVMPGDNDARVAMPLLLSTPGGLELLFSSRPPLCGTCTWSGWLQPLGPELEALGPPIKLSEGAQSIEAVSLKDPRQAVLTWRGDDSKDLRSTLLTLEPEPSVGTISPVSISLASHGAPRVAPGDLGWLVTWADSRITGDGAASYRGRVAAVKLDSSGSPLADPVSLVEDYRPVVDLVRGEGTWLMANESSDGFELYLVSESLHASKVTVSGAALRATPRIAASPDGWLVAWQELTEESSSTLHAARLDATGAILDSEALVELQLGRVYEMKALYADGTYSVLWAPPDGGVTSVSIPASGTFSVTQPQKLFDTNEQLQAFDITRVGDGWWGWFGSITATGFRTSGGKVFPQPYPPLPLVTVDGLVLTGVPGDGSFALGLAEPEESFYPLANVRWSAIADLSEAVEHRALLATLDYEWNLGANFRRISTRVVTVSGGLEPSGGMGGVGGEAGAPAVDSGGSAGMTEPSNAGEAPDDTDSHAPRTSKGCGCRVADNDAPSHAGVTSALSGLALWRRRQRRRAGAGGRAAARP